MQEAAAGLCIYNFFKFVQQVFNRQIRKRERASDQQTEHDLKMPLWTCVIFKVIARDSTLAQLDAVRLYSIQYGVVILRIAITGGL